MVTELVAAGMSGGSWDQVEREYGLDRYRALRDHWIRHGPPVYMSVALYLGMTKPEPEQVGSTPDDMAALVAAINGAR